MSEFKVGDKVTCLVDGKGVVSSVESISFTFPITVHFENGSITAYTEGGYGEDGLKLLYKGHGTFNIEFIKE